MKSSIVNRIISVCLLAPAALGLPVSAVRAQAEPEPIPAGVAPPPGPYAPGMDVLHYGLEIALDSGDRIEGRAAIRVRLVDPVPDALLFDLTGLAVGGVTIDGARVEYELDSGRIRVPLTGVHAIGDELVVGVEYGGRPDDGLILRDNVHGARAAFADNWPNRARFWFPSVDHPSDKATVSFTVHAPAGWRVIANGRMEGEPGPTAAGALGGGADRRTWRWRTDVPIPSYTMVVGGAPLEVREVGLGACGAAPASPREDGCVLSTYWVFPADTARAAPSFERASEMVDFFSELVGPFPYEKMAHVQSATRFGGMENASAIFYSESGISEGRNIEGTVSHEIAHQWFGDSATEAEWHHLWLSEGFATYFGALFFEHADGVEALRERMEQNRSRYLQSGVAERPVIDESETDLFALLNANNYQKGGWVLHMLRDLVGDVAFFAGVRSYYAEYAHSTALTADLQRHMEAAADTDLDWFFRQWLHAPGHPVLAVDWEENGQGQVTLVVEQLQPANWPTFRFPLTVDLVDEGGDRRRERLSVEGRREVVPISGSPPAALEVDPDGALLKELRR